MNAASTVPELAALNARLAAARGRLYWRTLEEVADSAAFQELLAREYPSQAAAWIDPIRRRSFLKLMAAALALGGFVGACGSEPREPIVPYVHAPEDMEPGTPLYFATAMAPTAGLGVGLLVKSHFGRPIKIEGNPDHPASLGATDRFSQASILTLYDPARLQTVTFAGAIRTRTDFLAALRSALAVQRARRGAGLRILTETVTSPTLAAELRTLLDALPEARWHQWEPAGRHLVAAGTEAAFGVDLRPIHHLADADVVVALDADFLDCGPGHLRDVRAFAARRRPDGAMSRLYAAESRLTPTGAKADHRIALRAADVGHVAAALAAACGVAGAPSGAEGLPTRWITAAAGDLRAHRGRSVVIAGETQPPAVQALAHLTNVALGNVGRTVAYVPPPEARSEDQLASLRALVDDMAAGRVECLVVVGGDPAFTAPADVPFAGAMDRVPLRVHVALYANATSARCHWVVPEAHYLESWGDVRAFDGTASIVQPLIAPLYDGRSALEIVAAMGADVERSGHDLVRAHWAAERHADVDAGWRDWLERGVIPGTALAPREVTARAAPALDAGGGTGLEVVFRPDPAIHDGRYAPNVWLQELPRPLTHVTWDSVAELAPATAARLGIRNEDVVELALGGRTVRAPAFVAPGHAEDSVTVFFGYGAPGAFGEYGYDGYAIRHANALWHASGLAVRATGARRRLATTHAHQRMEGRDIVRVHPIAEYLQQAGRRQPPDAALHSDQSLYPGWQYPGHRWAMAIDLGACVGCQACVVACQAENNVPTVGKTEVLRGREMHWLRIDTYFTGAPAAPDAFFMPVPCMQCEQAPCELVCPVEATVHGAEGLNDMVYNRCVGTRYCSNNCPYKVRRFNFFEYSRWNVESLKLLYNPDVTVRSRGVMEKCTYCVQRIRHAEIAAQRDERPIRDGEVVTACQQACPAGAIVFGDLNDAGSRVRLLKTEARNYALLEELNTLPRTTYLAAITNPNRDLA